ncbi:MAG: HD domain-containing protein [Desulfobacterales bacterium]|jgi:HD-GYP domain-containing protein (c-di-GMP phosphodiesterase class II)
MNYVLLRRLKSNEVNNDLQEKNYIAIRNSQINYYKAVGLYYLENGSFVLYKPPGRLMADLRLKQERHPPELYIRRKDRMAALKELQAGFNQHIFDSIKTGNVVAVKSTLCHLVEETLREPRSGTLQVLPETIATLVSGYSKNPQILKSFATMSFKDYSTVIHSVNVMALTLGFCFYSKRSLRETKRLGLSALLHDVGKTEIPDDILKAPRRLTSTEFRVMKRHPKLGEFLIKVKSGIDGDIARGAGEHHEKLDGSGYPKGTQKISFVGQVLGIIDCYEALTNEERPYRRAKSPLDALKTIKTDVEAGKFDRNIFEKFCYSLI